MSVLMLSLLALGGCGIDPLLPEPIGDADTDVDVDTDTDADTDCPEAAFDAASFDESCFAD